MEAPKITTQFTPINEPCPWTTPATGRFTSGQLWAQFERECGDLATIVSLELQFNEENPAPPDQDLAE